MAGELWRIAYLYPEKGLRSSRIEHSSAAKRIRPNKPNKQERLPDSSRGPMPSSTMPGLMWICGVKGAAMPFRGIGGWGARVAAVLLLLPLVSLVPAQSDDEEAEEEKSRPRLSIGDFKVFKVDQPVTGKYAFTHPATWVERTLEILRGTEPGQALKGVLIPDGTEILSLYSRSGSVGYQGELIGLLEGCGQERVPITEFLPLGDKVIVRLDALPPESSCPFLEDPANARLVVAPTDKPIRLRGAGEITSTASRSQIGLDGMRRTSATPIVADAVLVEGGTELKFVGRMRGLDGSVWIEVEAMISPAPGIEPPRGYMMVDELRIAASMTLVRTKDGTEETD
jgi:hypothetical protein